MKLIRDIDRRCFQHGCVVSIGNFDGVHLGHQAIIERVINKSKAYQVPSVIMTFEPHPHEYFNLESTDRIMGLREKYNTLSSLGVDYLIVLRFNADFAATSAEDFISGYLLNGLNIKMLIVGDDFRFGQRRAGDFKLLEQAAEIHNFKLENTQTLEVDGARVSSSRIRELLRRQDFSAAQSMLGHPFSISGKVTHGDKRGRVWGFPTLNLCLKKNRTLVSGVFAVEVEGLGTTQKGVANMGYRPTIHGTRPILEVHLFDYDQNCYGQRIKVVFKTKIRDEAKFATIDELKAQIQLDADKARKILYQQNIGLKG